MSELALYTITREILSADRLTSLVSGPDAGAVILFIGTVREWTKGKRTLYLEYEAYEPMAVKALAAIGTEISEKWPGARSAMAHRIGRLEIGEAAVVIAVSSAHREDAYAASRYAIERIKEIVPIWKKEHWEDGTAWIGSQNEQVPYDELRKELER